MQQRLLKHGLASVAALFLLAACSTTQLTSVWRDSEYQGPPLEKIVVIGVSNEISARRVFEDEFSAALNQAGIQAIPGYRLLPEKPDRPVEQLRAAIAENQADGILVARTVRTERRTEYSPGSIMVMPAIGYPNFWGFYGAAAFVTEPKIYTYDVVTIETNLWSAKGGHVLWSALSETTDPSNVHRLTTSLSRLVIQALQEQNLIAAPNLRK